MSGSEKENFSISPWAKVHLFDPVPKKSPVIAKEYFQTDVIFKICHRREIRLTTKRRGLVDQVRFVDPAIRLGESELDSFHA